MYKQWTIIRVKNKHSRLSIEEAMMMDDCSVEFHHDIIFDVDIILTHDVYVQQYYKEVLSKPLTMDTFNLECSLLKWKEIFELKDMKDLITIMKDGILCYRDLLDYMDERERSQLTSILSFAEILENVKSEEVVIAFDDERFGNHNIGDLIHTFDKKFSIDYTVILLPLWYKLKETL